MAKAQTLRFVESKSQFPDERTARPTRHGSLRCDTMDAGEALKRIGFLLERSRAPTFRVAAFRGAAAALSALEPGELERLAGNGELRSLRGIGAVTEAVVLQALAGGVPEYLAKLEAEPPPSVALAFSRHRSFGTGRQRSQRIS